MAPPHPNDAANGESRPSTSSSVRRGPRLSSRIQALAELFESRARSTREESDPLRSPSLPDLGHTAIQDVEGSKQAPRRPSIATNDVAGPSKVVMTALGDMDWRPIAKKPRKGQASSRLSYTAPDSFHRSQKAESAEGTGDGEVELHQEVVEAVVSQKPRNLQDSRPLSRSSLLPNASCGIQQEYEKAAQASQGLSMDSSLPHRKRRPDGLPNFVTEELPYLPRRLQTDLAKDEEIGLMSDSDNSSSSGTNPPSDQRALGTNCPAKAVPASKVFSGDALPLHLPELDDLLANQDLFAAPTFSSGPDICSKDEALLFGYSKPRVGSTQHLEVCGAQLVIPHHPNLSANLRRRHARTAKPSHTQPEQIEMEDIEKQSSAASPMPTSATLKESEAKDKHREGTEISEGDWSSDSTKSRAETRLQIFPPLMLLRDNSLNELKSNAVGPRKPPGGFFGTLLGLTSFIGTVIDFLIGVEGSSFSAGILRLEIFLDFVQMLDLNQHFVSSQSGVGLSHDRLSVHSILLRYIPGILSLNLVSVFGQAIIVFFTFLAVVFILLCQFWRLTRKYNPNRSLEGYQSLPWLFNLIRPASIQKEAQVGTHVVPRVKPLKSTVWSKVGKMLLVAALTLLYLPVSKLAVDALVWSIDYWPESAKTAGNIEELRGFCYQTTSDPGQFNWAFVILPAAAITVLCVTIWFPFQMMKTIKQYLPHVSEFDELGQRRSSDELEAEYMALLSRDSSPLNFMYTAYRRRWGTYKPLYILCFKLSSLLIVSVFSQQNCLWHRFKPQTMLIVQQSVLLALQVILLAVQVFVAPFIDIVSNRSEAFGRITYVASSLVGLKVALGKHGENQTEYTLLYVFNGLSYAVEIYFIFVSTYWMGHMIKRWQNRIDFSIDIFSPKIALDKHIKRRIWQETLSTLLLTAHEYRMSINQLMTFSASDKWPPYLLQFQGSAAERHIENLKILKAIGLDRFKASIECFRSGEEAERWKVAIKHIQLEFSGPDAYWQPLETSPGASRRALQGVTSYFGKAFMIPFPPTLVIQYDQTTHPRELLTLQLTKLEDLETFIWQNESKFVQDRRAVRLALRALDGQRVYCPHVRAVKVGRQSTLQKITGSLDKSANRFTLAKPTYYEEGTLLVRSRFLQATGEPMFEVGFEVFIQYSRGQRRDAEGMTVDRCPLIIDAAKAFGLRDDFELGSSVQRFFRENEDTIEFRMPQIRQMLQNYRLNYRREAVEKRKVMNYSFLTDVFDTPVLYREEFEEAFKQSSCSKIVQELPQRYPGTTTLLLERLRHVQRTPMHQWWYLFWDDLWRQNRDDFSALRAHQTTFNPQLRTSIAYHPMPRQRLESLLRSKKGIWSQTKASCNFDHAAMPERTSQKCSSGKQRGIFNSGLLNRIYFMLDEIAFDRNLGQDHHWPSMEHSGKPMVFGTLNSNGEFDPRSVATLSDFAALEKDHMHRFHNIPVYYDPFTASSRHTGGGTDHDEVRIKSRYAWPWTEQRMTGLPSLSWPQRIQRAMLQWLAIYPYKINTEIRQLYIYLQVVDGRYEAAMSGAVLKPGFQTDSSL